jgi:hydroxymethylbilane synthase
MAAPVRVATRGSELARAQAHAVITRLGVDAELVIVSTTGDRRTDTPIHALGGTGVFVKEVQEAVLDGRADVGVHSAKDLPSVTAPGLVIGAVTERGDARDALVGSTLDALPTGAHVGTGAVRRRAQLAAARPDLTFGELRGNIGTRLDKAAHFDAVVMAAVALERLGLADRIAQRLEPTQMLPQVGQGAIAVECREDDGDLRTLLADITDRHAHRAVTAERAFLAELGGGCNLPCGALARATDTAVEIEVLLASLDGHTVLRTRDTGTDPAAVGVAAALALLDDHGGRALLEEVA